MSASEKASGHVRFRDGDDLVEFDDGPKSAQKPEVPSSKRKGTKDTDKAATASPAKPAELPSPSTSNKVSKNKSIKDKTSDDSKPTVVDSVPDRRVETAVPAAVVQQEEKREVDEVKLKYFSAFQTINRVHGGAIMKIKVGVAGATPAKDSFPMFSSSKRWVCLHWDADSAPSQWCVAYYAEAPAWFDRALQIISAGGAGAGSSGSSKHGTTSGSSSEKSSPTNASNVELGDAFTSGISAASHGPGLIESSLFPLPELSTALKTIRMHEISDLYLEAAPAVAFRLYCGKEVIHFTPVNAYNVLSKRSSCWADSIYSALALLQEPDMELVQLYKQEFVSLLQQHADDQQQTHSDAASNGVGAGPGAGSSSGDGTSDAPVPRRPGMMRRRSTLSNFLGISASKPLDEAVFENSPSGAQQSDGENDASEAPELRKKTSFFSTVNKVRSAIKQTLLSSHSSDKEDSKSNRLSFKQTWLLDRKASIIKNKRPSYYQQVNSAPADGGEAQEGTHQGEGEEGAESQDERASGEHTGGSLSGSAKHSPVPVEKGPNTHAPPPSSANFLSQSLLSMRSGLNLNSANPRSPSPGGASTGAGASTSNTDLQTQIEELLEQNRLLQHQLYAGSGSTDGAHNTVGSPSTTKTSASNNQPFQQRSSSPSSNTPATIQSTTQSGLSLPPIEYTTKELTTLRAFTARTNFHQNKNASKNAARAFGGDSKSSDLQKYRHPSPTTKTKVDTAQPLLGTASVLDRLLSQQSTATTVAHNVADGQFSYQGDDYYNDTIELDPLSIVQLLELHKLQQLEHRREVSNNNEDGRASDAEGEGGSGVEEGVVPSPQSRRRRESATARRINLQSAAPAPPMPSEPHSVEHFDGPLAMEAPAASTSPSTATSRAQPLPPPTTAQDSTLLVQGKPPAVMKKTCLGSGIQLHPSAAQPAATLAVATTTPAAATPSLLHKQPSLASALSPSGPTTTAGSKPKKSVSIVDQQLQATTQRELRLLNLLSGAEPPPLPPPTESVQGKARSYSVESEHKSDGERRGRSDSSSKLTTVGGVSASDKSDHAVSKSSDGHPNKNRSDSLQSDSSSSRPLPSPASHVSPAKSAAATAGSISQVDSPDRARKAVQRRQLSGNSSSAKVSSTGRLGSGLLAAAMPRLSIGTVESDRQNDRHSDSQHSSSSKAVRGSAEFERTVDGTKVLAMNTNTGKNVRTAKLGDNVHTPITSTSAPVEVPVGVAKPTVPARDGVPNMRPYSYDSGPEGGTESSATVTDIESLKAPKWSNNYFYANSNPRREVKRMRRGRLTADMSAEGAPALNTTNTGVVDINSVSWNVFLAGLPSAHTVHAVCAAGAVECLLLSQRELLSALRVCKMRLFCADSKAGMQSFSAQDALTLVNTEEYFVVLVHAGAGELVFVPLSDMVGAELDTNNTGLFKLTMRLCQSTAVSDPHPHVSGSGDGGDSLVRSLAAQIVSAQDTEHTPRSRSEQRGADHIGDGAGTGIHAVQAVSLVLKATQTLQLVEWLTSLMDLRM